MSGIARSRQTHVDGSAHREFFERPALALPVFKISQGNLLGVAAVLLLIDDYHAIQVRHRKGTQHDCIHDAKRRRIHADADGEGQDCGDRESWRLQQLADRISHVLKQDLHEIPFSPPQPAAFLNNYSAISRPNQPPLITNDFKPGMLAGTARMSTINDQLSASEQLNLCCCLLWTIGVGRPAGYDFLDFIPANNGR